MSEDRVTIRREGDVEIWTITREHKRNALDEAAWKALQAAAVAAGEAPIPPRVVILHGAGEHFSAGMDLSMDNPLLGRIAPAVQEGSWEELHDVINELKEVLRTIADLPCPTVAAIEGACIGGGMELALACDLRIASDTAFFGLPEMRWGMVPDVGGTVRSVRLLGRSRASDLILSGRTIDADTAENWGLVSRRCSEGEALDTAIAAARELRRSSPNAARELLPVLRSVDSQTDEEAFQAETHAGMNTLLTKDVFAGMQAFQSKQDPPWVK